MRKYYRTIAKARMKAAGCDRVNRKLGMKINGEANWRRVIFGDLAKDAEGWQIKRRGRQSRAKNRKLAEA